MSKQLFVAKLVLLAAILVMSRGFELDFSSLRSMFSSDFSFDNPPKCRSLFKFPNTNGTKTLELSGTIAVKRMNHIGNGRIAVSSLEGAIDIWDLNTGVLEVTLKDEESSDTTMLADGRLATQSDENIFKIWNIQTGECEKTFNVTVDNDFPRTLHLQDGRIAITSSEDVVSIWNEKVKGFELHLSGHNNTINSLIQLSDRNIVSSSTDGVIKIWNPLTGECIRTLSDGDSSISFLLELSDGRLSIIDEDDTLKIWNMATGICDLTIVNSRTPLIQLRDNRLFLLKGNDANLCNLYTGKCEVAINNVDYRKPWSLWNLFHFQKRTKNIQFLELEDGQVAISDPDSIILWDPTNEKEQVIRHAEAGREGVVQLADGRLARAIGDEILIWSEVAKECDVTATNGAKFRYIATPDGMMSVTAILGDEQ